MNTNDREEPAPAPKGGTRQPQAFDASPRVTTFSYDAKGLPADAAAPQRMPISAQEMTALLMLIQNIQTRLLWLHCDWAEAAREGRLAPAELRAKVGLAFDKLREQFLAHLTAKLEVCPAPIIIEAPTGDSGPPGGK